MSITAEQVAEMERICVEARKWTVRMVADVGIAAHVGGALSCTEILTTLYFRQMRIKPEDPCWPERDRCLLSKGHAGPGMYPVLALRGYLPLDELCTLDAPGTRLSEHVDHNKLVACDVSAGMLGQGLSIGIGMALGARLTGNPAHTYVIMGDGEQQSGQVWEAAMCAAHYRLDNLTAIIDKNGFQVDGAIGDIMSIEPLAEKWRAFGWNVLEVDGHDIGQLLRAYDLALSRKGQPTLIIAHTVKGKGVSFAEGKTEWHHHTITEEQCRIALAELGEVQ